MIEKIKNPSIQTLFDSILTLKTTEECYAFFDDICTVNELKSLVQRLDVAAMLLDNKTYVHIGEATGASTATISRVNRALQYGSNGYQMVLGRLKEKMNNQYNGTGE